MNSRTFLLRFRTGKRFLENENSENKVKITLQ